MMIAVVLLSLHISWVSESIKLTMSSQINKGTVMRSVLACFLCTLHV